MAFSIRNIFASIKAIYTPVFFLLNVAIAVIYFIIFTLILKSQGPIALTTTPLYLIYVLVITSSMLITASIYSLIKKTANGAMLAADGIGTIMTFLGGIISGCNCTAPLLFELVAVGISSSEIVGLDDFISAYQVWIFLAIIAVNIVLLANMLNAISDTRKSWRKRQK